MENNINVEELKKQAINEIIAKIENQIKEDGTVVGDMNFDKVSTIERSDEGRIILQYPLENPYEVGGKSNWTKIIVYPDGVVRIMGNQLDANKRAGKTDTANGAYAFNMKLEDWKETKTIKKAIDADEELKYDLSIKEMAEKVEEDQEYGIEEIEETVSDRTVTDLNKTVDDIKEVEKVEEKEDKKRIKKDIVED